MESVNEIEIFSECSNLSLCVTGSDFIISLDRENHLNVPGMNLTGIDTKDLSNYAT